MREVMRCEISPAQEMCTFSFFIFENNQTWGIRIQYSSVFDNIFLSIHVYSVYIKKYEYKYSYCIQILF